MKISHRTNLLSWAAAGPAGTDSALIFGNNYEILEYVEVYWKNKHAAQFVFNSFFSQSTSRQS